MMPQRLLPFLLALLTSFSLCAQLPPICATDEVPEMAAFCADACVICDIDGFSGRNGRDAQYELPNDFCTLQQHNGKWIGFVAGSEDLAVRMNVSNCQQNDGLEIAIYEAIDCENFRVVSNCFGGFGLIRPNTSQVFRNLEPLTIGQYYYLVMDGGRNDVCDWEFTVVEGTTELAPLAEVQFIDGPRRVCPGVIDTFDVPEQLGATEYTWTIDGTPAGREATFAFAFPDEGIFELCVQPKNACNDVSPFCVDVVVRAIPDRLERINLCVGDTLAFADTLITDGGRFSFPFVTAAGCDSTVILDVTPIPSTLDEVRAFFCTDDTLRFNGTAYTETGVYEQTLTNRFGCDSTLRLDLRAIECNIEAIGAGTQVQCKGFSNGRYAFTVTRGTPPFTYAFGAFGAPPTRSGSILGLGDTTVVEGLGAGTYQVTILDEFGNDTRILNVVIGEPDLLDATVRLSNYNGVNVSCFGSTDGAISVEGLGGTPPYSIVWSDGATGFERANLTAGNYPYTLTDSRGCFLVDDVPLTRPAAVTASILATDPDCSGPFSGSISLAGLVGGVGGFRSQLNGEPFDSSGRVRGGLPSGEYAVRVADANGCPFDTTLALSGTLIPGLRLPDRLIADLGTPASLRPATVDTDSLIYELPAGNPVLDALEDGLSFTAINPGFVYVTALSPDGCTVRDSVPLIVINNRAVYAPTAFSPNADGVNDVFFLHSGPGVATVESLRVYDRWGGEVFAGAGATTFELGWDGGEAPVGVYVWIARVRFLNGEVAVIRGDVVLL